MMTLVKLVATDSSRVALVIETLRVWTVEPANYRFRDTPERTLIWVAEQPHPFVIAGNHDEALTKAVRTAAEGFGS